MDEPSPLRSDNPERRRQLLEKVESLISVLEVAQRKVLRNLAAPGADRRRLERVRRNLEGTLTVCRRARSVLQEQLAAQRAAAGGEASMTLGEYLECGSVGEYRRLRQLGPVSADEVRRVDLDELCRRLANTDPRADQEPQSRA